MTLPRAGKGMVVHYKTKRLNAFASENSGVNGGYGNVHIGELNQFWLIRK